MRQFNALNPLNVMRQAFESSFGRDASASRDASAATEKKPSDQDN